VPVLVVYMALTHLEEITRRLIAAGRRPDEAAALVSKATTPDQKVVVATLADIAGAARTHRVEPPAMLVVGDVVTYRSRLDWLAAHGELS
jgi:uroporphyrin-III C-methyltransferase